MPMDATTGKALMRAQFKAVREGLIPGERGAIDEAIARNVAARRSSARADAVFTYLSFGAEVDTRELIQRAWEAGKTVCLPRVVPGTREMRWYAVESLDRLVRSSFGVEEPPDDPSREVHPADFVRPVALRCPGSPSTAKVSVWATAAASTTRSCLLFPAPPSASSAPASWSSGSPCETSMMHPSTSLR